jgi:cobalt-zinc-cadmium efflux system protein
MHFEAHVDFSNNYSLVEMEEIFGRIKEILHDKYNIHHITLQPEFDSCEKKELITQGH